MTGYGLVEAAASPDGAANLSEHSDLTPGSESNTANDPPSLNPYHTAAPAQPSAPQAPRWLWSIITSVIITIVALSVSAVLITNFTDSETTRDFFIEYFLNLGAGILVFYLCTIAWIGVEAPFSLSVLRLAAIDALAYLAYFVAAFYLSFLLGFIVMFVVYIGLLAAMLELEVGDAVMFAAIRILTKLLVMFPILNLIASLLSGL